MLCGDKIPILCNQENFLLKGNSYQIRKALPDSHIFFKSALKENQNYGRPKGGMFIAVPTCLMERFTEISTSFWRVQAVTFKTDDNLILILNIYFPTDPQTLRFDDEELNETYAAINDILKEGQL